VLKPSKQEKNLEAAGEERKTSSPQPAKQISQPEQSKIENSLKISSKYRDLEVMIPQKHLPKLKTL
jgi:hypothetical protein